MTLQSLLEMLKTAPKTQIDDCVMERINQVDCEDETKVRELLEYVYQSGFYGNVTPFVATLVDPRYTKDYLLK